MCDPHVQQSLDYAVYLLDMIVVRAQSHHLVMLRLRLISHEDIQGIFSPFFYRIQLRYAFIATIIKVSIQFEPCVFHHCRNGQATSTEHH